MSRQFSTHEHEKLAERLFRLIAQIALNHIGLTTGVEMLGESLHIDPGFVRSIIVSVQITGSDQATLPMIGVASGG